MARLFAALAERTPDAPALVDETGATTWAALDERINRLIDTLRTAGLEDGDTVALLCGNRREFFEVMGAGLHAGWMVVALDPAWGVREIATLLASSGAKALIADARIAAGLADLSPGCVRIAVGARPPAGLLAYEELLAVGRPAEPERQRAGGPMFCTSGATGFPKAVRSSLVPPGVGPSALGTVAQTWNALVGIPAGGVTLLVGPAHDRTEWTFAMLPLVTGSTLVMRRRFDAAETLGTIDRLQVTNVHLVPTQLVRLLELPEATRAAFRGSSLVRVLHGAAPCPPEVKRRMLAWWGPKLTEYYGGAEGGVLTQISSAEWLAKPGSVGQPTYLVELVIVRDDGARAAPGEPGQVYFRSRLGLDFEYPRDAVRTAAAHLEPGLGTLGDVGYLDADGYLFLRDRKVDMIVSGGVDVCPAELEGVLVTHPAVADAAVFGIPHAEMGEEVRAAVALAGGWAPSAALAAELVAYVRAHLASDAVPCSIAFEASLPRHPTGRLLKRVLRARHAASVGPSR
jgi:long-chain acyl-CoA synthetase